MVVEQLYVKTRSEWREWLFRNHSVKKEVWLIYYRKDSRKPGVSYDDSVEEALCFGWVDSIIKKLDGEKYVRKFTPRKDGSRWSETNKRRISRMVEEGRITEAGIEKIRDAMNSGEWKKTRKVNRSLEVPSYFTEALAKNEEALRNFEGMALTYKRHFVGWVDSAKREETRRKRLVEAISLLESNRKLGLK